MLGIKALLEHCELEIFGFGLSITWSDLEEKHRGMSLVFLEEAQQFVNVGEIRFYIIRLNLTVIDDERRPSLEVGQVAEVEL